jgi:hypothetical protein
MMAEKTAQRIIDAFDTVRSGVYPHWWTEQMERDVNWLRERYNAFKWHMLFSEAMRKAQTEFIILVAAQQAREPDKGNAARPRTAPASGRKWS